MTDPNPLKQAAEEAKARKLAEVANAALSYEARLREAVTKHFEIADGPLHIHRDWQTPRLLERLEKFDMSSDISVDDLMLVLEAEAAESGAEETADEAVAATGDEADVYIVRPKGILTRSHLTHLLQEDDLVPSGLLDLISIERNESCGDAYIYALGAKFDRQLAAIRGPNLAGNDALDHAPIGDGWGPGQLLLVRLGPRAQARVNAVIKSVNP